MNVQSEGDCVRISSDCFHEVLTREEALAFLAELSEAIRMCRVYLDPGVPYAQGPWRSSVQAGDAV